MKLRTMYTGLALAYGLIAGSLTIAYNRAVHDLEKDGYRDVKVAVLPIYLGKEPFQNDFSAKTADGSAVTGSISQNWTNSQHKVTLNPPKS